jgi:glycine C-acetyltransferase
MRLNNFYRRLLFDESTTRKIGMSPYYVEIESGLDDPILIQGREFINLASNNYLGLASDPRVKKAMIEATDKYGASMCGTPIATGYVDIYKKVEEELSRFVGLESSIIFPSAYQANNGLFTAIAGRDDLIIVDHFAHSSLIQGIRGVNCKIKPFLHNDMKSLHKIL